MRHSLFGLLTLASFGCLGLAALTGCSSSDGSSNSKPGANGGGADSGASASGGGGGSSGGSSGGRSGSSGGTNGGGAGGSNGGAPSTGGSGGNAQGGTATDGGTGDASAPDSGSCTPILNTAAPIDTTCSSGSQPTGSGGPIVDGLYYLTAKVSFDGACTPGTDRATMEISGGGTLARIHGGQGPVNVQADVAGSTITLTPLCSAGGPQQMTYTADPNTLTIFNPVSKDVVTFTLASAITACNTIANVGTDVPFTSNQAAPPAMTGGTILDGTYVRTGLTEYSSSATSTLTRRDTIQVTGTTVEAVLRANGGIDQHATMTYVTSGTNDITFTWTCGNTGNMARKYTATTTTLSFLNESNATVDEFTKQ